MKKLLILSGSLMIFAVSGSLAADPAAPVTAHPSSALTKAGELETAQPAQAAPQHNARPTRRAEGYPDVGPGNEQLQPRPFTENDAISKVKAMPMFAGQGFTDWQVNKVQGYFEVSAIKDGKRVKVKLDENTGQIENK